MSEPDRKDRIERILVAVDASPNSIIALHTAIDLARRTRAELRALFIQESYLHHLGSYPFAREIGHYTAQSRRIGSREIRLQMRAQSKRIRSMLETLAKEARVHWTYNVMKGKTSDLKDAAEDADLIVLGRSGWSGRKKLGSTVQFILTQYPARTLIIGDRPGSPSPIFVVYDGSDSSKRALALASNLIRNSEGFLTVGILSDTSERAKQLQKEAYQWLSERNLEPRFRWILDWSVDKVNALARTESCLLILPRSIEALEENAVSEVIDEMDCPVLFVQ
jgi:nucleotide-binding universal stress UspA family protein